MAEQKRLSNKIEGFFSKYPLKEYEKDQIILFADENPKHIIYLISGYVREYDISPNGEEVVVNLFKPPAFFPMAWAIGEIPNRYFFEAGEKTTARLAPPKDVLAFIKDNPEVLLDLLSRVYRGVDGMRRRMAHLMGGTARSRLLFELILTCQRFGKKGKGNSYTIKISEGEIGARAGLSRETVSRLMKGLKKENLVSVNKASITVNDLEQMQNTLGKNL